MDDRFAEPFFFYVCISFISNTAEKQSLSSFGRKEQTPFDSLSGNMGTTLSTR
jgi:hypothetical protein